VLHRDKDYIAVVGLDRFVRYFLY